MTGYDDKNMIIDIIARTPPAICIAGGIYSYLTGNKGFGIFLVVVGVILQILWLYFD